MLKDNVALFGSHISYKFSDSQMILTGGSAWCLLRSWLGSFRDR
ncbi:hypothetical protein Hanom_Chr04g00355081 [Helianthus anomalus]